MALFLTLLLVAQVDRPVRAVPDPGVITTRQTITPAGVPTVFQGRVYGVAFGPDPSELWVLNANHVYRLDWRQNKVLGRVVHGGAPGLQSLSFANGAAYFGMKQGSGAGQVRLAKLAPGDLSPLVLTGSLGERVARLTTAIALIPPQDTYNRPLPNARALGAIPATLCAKG